MTAPNTKHRRCESVNLEGYLDQIVRVPRDLNSRHSSRPDQRNDTFQKSVNQNSLFETSRQQGSKMKRSGMSETQRLGLAYQKQ